MNGRTVVIAGPDGAGKSALADALVEQLGGGGHVLRFHHRASILPRKTAMAGPVTEPHAKPVYGRVAGSAKVLWLAVDMQLMWRILVPRATRSGKDVVVERGWWDLVVDPRRYRLAGTGLTARLGRLLPAPDLELILGGPAEVLAARKPELSIAELERQLAAWRTLRPSGPRVLHLDATQPVATLTQQVVDRLAAGTPGAASAEAAAVGIDAHGWAHLPPGSATPRFQLPRGPRSVAKAGLRVYHPVTRRGAFAWRAARLAAAVGGFRLLPVRPAPEIASVILSVLPPGTVTAVAAAGRAERANVLALDATGRPVAVAKIARDEAGRRRLVHEAEAGERLRSALPAPLSGPPLLHQGDGFLLFAAVDWISRPRAWSLPDDVAWAMGRFHLAGRKAGSTAGYTHGDFAPWNLLRTAVGWSLIDWADARDDGPAFYDPLHYIVQSHALLGRPSRKEILAGLRGEGTVGSMLRAYAQGAELDLAEAPRRMHDYLDVSERTLVPGADQARGRRARAHLRVRLTDPGA
jgi:thymidylate kinase